MLYNPLHLLERLQAIHLPTASPTVVKAAGALASMLTPHHEGFRPLARAFSTLAARRFAEAGTPEAQDTWLDTLLHLNPTGDLFADMEDDDEYAALHAKQHEVETRWLNNILPLLHPRSGASRSAREDSPLHQRLLHLHRFLLQDINRISGADDGQARALLTSARSIFEQCRDTLFTGCTDNTGSYLLYYHVLTAVRPDQTSPDNVRHYHQYFRDFNERHADARDTDLSWSFLEILWHHRLALESHDDLSALQGLWLATPEALTGFRLQLYKWHLELDPYDTHSIGDCTRKADYAGEGLRRLSSWLTAKQEAGIPIPTERKADILMAYSLAHCLGAYEPTLDDFFYAQADEVLSLLPPSKRKTHFKALLHFLLPDPQLQEEALQEAQAWLPTRLTPEDHFLLEELTLSPCTANL